MKKSNLMTVIAMSLFFFGMFAWTIIADTPDYSDSERRVLAGFPEISVESMLEGNFAEGFDEYAVERFPARDMWRSVKAYASKLLLQKDNNGIYTADGHISKIEYPMNVEMLDHAIGVMNKVNRLYLEPSSQLGSDSTPAGDSAQSSNNALSGGNVYFAIIPDKNRFLAGESNHLALDYDELTDYVVSKMDFAKYIEIQDLLDAEDYYYTDSHWRQEKIVDVAERLAGEMTGEMTGEMGATVQSEGLSQSGTSALNQNTASSAQKYTIKSLNTEFKGVYLGQSALKWQPDTIKYLTNDVIDGAEVTLVGPTRNSKKPAGTQTETEEPRPVYDMDKLTGKDPYEMFLSGNQPIVKIKNTVKAGSGSQYAGLVKAGSGSPNGESNGSPADRLIVFRDSFGSSLAPLLIEYYSEVILVDLRYISSDMVGDYVDFTNADVLFIYSTSMLNNSLAIR